ncbi:MAG TPA: cytochrome c3 family protein, partial [Anaeromyxobacteraceae bacterium]|nr:cytochrome c3 family protein [Anaeromyxobacteraceae bacterium]
EVGAKLCLECHGPLMQPGQTTNHRPFADGQCLLCHDPHGSNAPGMVRADEKTLCLGCHSKQAKEAQGAASVHRAFEVGDCTKCHSPHKSNLKSLLLAQSPDLCLACHLATKERIATKKAHQPTSDCFICHRPHAAPQPSLTSEPRSELCGQCHDENKEFSAAHLGIGAKNMDCTSCHDPHASDDPKFFKSMEHAPFATRACDSCHLGPKN